MVTRLSITLVAAIFLMASLGVLMGACRYKVPLKEDFGAFAVASAHWFENEQVAYLFFQLREREGVLRNPVWELSYGLTNQGAVQPGQPIDFKAGVHDHGTVPCGESLCGSYSFRANAPLRFVKLVLRYDPDSPLVNEVNAEVTNHPAGNTSDSYSALLYGVFDQSNERMAVVVHNNFGTPNNNEVTAYGMNRRFFVSDPGLEDKSADEVSEQLATVGSNLLFPAEFCSGAGTIGASGVEVTGTHLWLADQFTAGIESRGACFGVQYLDRSGNPLLGVPTKGYGRRNPEIRIPASDVATPLVNAIELPIFLKVCDDDPFRDQLTDDEFLSYQNFILDFGGRPVDVCFRQGAEEAFRTELADHLTSRLEEARAGTSDRDFIFVVLLHEAFSEEFTTLQSVIADELTRVASREREKITPRLVGAMVYSASTHFAPTALQRQYVMWCPQELDASIQQDGAALAEQNCTTSKAFELDLEVINFVAPLGPFPSLKNYKEYIKEYGDAGVARNPNLQFSSVPTGANTLQEDRDQVTFFDGERFTLLDGERARFCSDQLDGAVTSLRFRPEDFADDIPSFDFLTATNLWLTSEAPGSYRFGIAWDYPFFGVVKYDSALTGTVGSIIPFQRSFREYQALGDPKWQKSRWRLGDYVEVCARYCDNPYFDEAGVYQPAASWAEAGPFYCPNSVFPAPSDG